ncbi:PKD domain-containing protein, partial [Patescibacteria group bacterium]|nr:PKD domain-containing protein [Patescibacteria group bacterium]
PEPYRSSYFLGDVTGNKIMRMVVGPNDTSSSVTTFFDDAMGPVEIMTGPDGFLYYLAIYNGELRKINYSANGNIAPIAKISSDKDVGPAPLTVVFSSAGSSDANGDTLTYTWNFGNGQTSTAANPTHTYTTNGTFTASVTVKDGKGGENTASKTIRVGTFVGNGANPILFSSKVEPTPNYIGFDVHTTATIKNNGTADPFIVDLEIYNAAGTKVAQQVWENETIAQNATKDFKISWFPSDIGNYRVAVGLFKANWTGLHQWYNEDIKFTVQNRAPGTTTPPTAGPFKPIFVSASSTPSTTQVGTTIPVKAAVKNTGVEGSVLVDIEIYKDGVKYGQEFYDNAIIATNAQREFTYNWTAPSTPGTYKISVGIFKPGWSEIYSWNADVSTITVTAGTTPPPPPPPPPTPSGAAIFQDSLATGWANWSWDVNADFNSTSPIAEGSKAIKVTHNSAWSGFYLHSDGTNTSGKNNLVFQINGGATGGQNVRVTFYDAAGAMVRKNIADYVGPLAANTWKTVTIPLADLNASNKTIMGLVFQGNNGAIQPVYSVDDIKLQ